MKLFLKNSLIFLTILVISCNSDDNEMNPENNSVILDELSGENLFLLKDSQGEKFYPFMVNDSTAHFYVGKKVDYSSLQFVLTNGYKSTIIDSIIQNVGSRVIDFSDFASPPKAYISSPDGQKCISIYLYDLPVIIIDTPEKQPILSKEERINDCKVNLVTSRGLDSIGLAGIKGRGNSTWVLSKKPYNIKFNKKQGLLGMKKSKHWLLLANAFYDRTQMHNAVAFEMARLTDYPWVQSGTYVELILNGEYRGLYYLCEKIGVESSKINIVKMTKNDILGDSLTGGYLLETKQPDDTDWYFQTNYFNTTQTDFAAPLCWNLKSPDQDEGVDSLQLVYIKNQMNLMEQLIWDEDSLKTGKYRQYFDIETAINWLLVEEATINGEASGTKNVFMYKNRGEDMFHIGPPWDFDAWSFGLRWKDRFWASQTGLYFHKLLKDPFFQNRLKQKWEIYRESWRNSIPQYIDEEASLIRNAALRNEKMWSDWHPLNNYPSKSWDEMINDMKVNLLRQIGWMDEQYNQNIFLN